MLKAIFFGLHFHRRQYAFIFNHFNVTGPQIYRIPYNNTKITIITPCSPVLVPIESHMLPPKFILVIHSNLHPISYRFQVIADNWSNLRFPRGSTSF